MRIKQSSKGTPEGCGKIFIFAWALFWIGITGVFDVVVIRGLILQSRTGSFQTTQGTIKESRVQVTHDSDGTTRSADITYEYQVAGTPYTSEQISFTGMSFDDADELVAQFPKGSQCTVYYDPEAPDQSVLRTTIDPGDLFVLIFLTPFNAIGLVAILTLLPFDSLPLGPHSVQHSQNVLRHRYRIYPWSRLTTAVIAGGGVGFLMVFLSLLLMWLLPGWIPVVIAFSVIGIAAMVGYFMCQPTVLEIDPLSREIRLHRDGKDYEATFPNGLDLVSEGKELTLRQPGNTTSPLPKIAFRSEVARAWLEEELRLHLRD